MPSQDSFRTVSGPSGVPPSRPPIRVPGRVRFRSSSRPMVTSTVDFTPAGTTLPHTTVPGVAAAESVSLRESVSVSYDVSKAAVVSMVVVVVGTTFHGSLAPTPVDHTPPKQPPVVRKNPSATRGLLLSMVAVA